MYNAHRLAAVIECVVDPAGNGPVLCEESTLDQTPEVENATDGVRVPTDIDAACRRIPHVPCGLQGFVERCVHFDISRCIGGVGRAYVEGAPVGWNAQDHFARWKAGAGPSLHGCRRGTLLSCSARVVKRSVRSDGGTPRTPKVVIHDLCMTFVRQE